MNDNVTPIRRGPLLTDIPGMLRQMADDYEAMPADERPKSVLVLEHVEGDFPTIFGFGEHLGDLGNIAVVALAQQWFIDNLTARDPG